MESQAQHTQNFTCVIGVQVRLKEYGGELIEIADNGGGVDAANHQSLTLKYHTSKLQQFSDLQVSLCSFAVTHLCDTTTPATPTSAFAKLLLWFHEQQLLYSLQEVSTFGFRGEALSSLCALATITITTRTPSTNPAQRLTYDHTGSLMGTAPAARAVGTTVAVKDLFKTLPVRHKVQADAIINVTHLQPSGSRHVLSNTTLHGCIHPRTHLGAAIFYQYAS